MITRSSRSLCSLAICLCCFFLDSPRANALNFTPTEIEWVTWPDYCRARYIVSGAGTGSEYARRISAAEITQQQTRMGDGWHWLHHYCAALAYFSRADAEVDERRIEYWLKEAEVNLMGYYQRISRDHPMFIEVATRIAQLHRQRGDTKVALTFLHEAIEVQPGASSPYALAAIIYRDNGDPEKAVSLLLEGDRSLDGKSAEIHYFLGLLYIELDDLDSAVRHAELAYNLGYPLPGLASKLRELGR
jgi:tetratricopeptide (TPR) repeat protein